MCFSQVDGVLARAIVHGGWVLMDNANLCNPTVLDRLNPLLEPNGEGLGGKVCICLIVGLRAFIIHDKCNLEIWAIN